jgi:hypothetical protein
MARRIVETPPPKSHPGPMPPLPQGRPAEVRAAEIVAAPLNRIADALEHLARPAPDGYLIGGKVYHPDDVTIIRRA